MSQELCQKYLKTEIVTEKYMFPEPIVRDQKSGYFHLFTHLYYSNGEEKNVPINIYTLMFSHILEPI